MTTLLSASEAFIRQSISQASLEPRLRAETSPRSVGPFTLIQVWRPVAKLNHCSKAASNGCGESLVPIRSRVMASFA